MIWYRYLPGIQVLLLPLFAGVAFAAAFGAGLWISALMVRYRDFSFIVPFVAQFGLYISPVGFSSSIVPEQMATPLFAEPHGGRHRRVSVGQSLVANMHFTGRDFCFPWGW